MWCSVRTIAILLGAAALTGCDKTHERTPTKSHDIFAENQVPSSVKLSPDSRLMRFISGKEMKPARKSLNHSVEKFFQDGNWESTSVEIDITRRKGIWVAGTNSASQSIVCVTVMEQDERKFAKPLKRCRYFAIDYDRSSAVVGYGGGHEEDQFVIFSNISS